MKYQLSSQCFAILLFCILHVNYIYAQVPIKPSSTEGHFIIADTSRIDSGELHTIIMGANIATLMDGQSIQSMRLIDSLYPLSVLRIQNIGGSLYLGNSKGLTKIESQFLVNTIEFPSGGLQHQASSEIAFGNISKGIRGTTTIESGTNNFEATWNSVTEEYDIIFDDYTYNRNDFTTIVTPRGTNVDRFRANGSPGKLHITFFDTSGSRIQSSFQFVTFYYQKIDFTRISD